MTQEDSSQNSDDPWKSWIANKGGTGLQPLMSSKAATSGPLTHQTRKIEAPIEDRFLKQATELQDMRERTERELTTMKESVQQLEKTIQQHGNQLQSNADQCRNEFAAIRAETQNQMGTMANMFQESLKQALSGHDQQMSTQFAEIKELLAGKAVTSPLPKRAKNQPKDQDDSSL